MDAKLEKDIAVLGLKAAGLDVRCQLVLAMADLLNEYRVLAGQQQKVISMLVESYEPKPTKKPQNTDATGGTVPSAPSAPT